MDKVSDYILRLKLDAKTLERDYPKVFAKLNKAQARQNVAFKQEATLLRKSNAERMRTIGIQRQQERLQSKIQRAEQAGVRISDRHKQRIRSNRADVLANADIGISRSIRANRQVGGAEQLGVDLASAKNRVHNVTDPSLRNRLSSSTGKLTDISAKLKVAKTTKQVRELRSAFSDVKKEINGITRQQEKFNRSMRKGNAVTNKFSSSLKHAGLQMVSFYAVVSGASAVFKIGKNMDSMQAGLLAASGSAEEAQSNFEFLKKSSMTLGTDIETGVGAFNRLAVAARGAGLSTAESREIFLSAAEASTTFGLDTQRQGLVMLAFSQIMSKGKVSMEELSRQLGENLPITMQAAASAMNMTQGEVMELVSAGKLMSKDFMLPFAREIRRMVRENGAYAASLKKVNASFGRFKNSLKFIISDAFNKGTAKSLSEIFSKLTKFIQSIAPAFTVVIVVASKAIELLVDVVYQLASVLGFSAEAMDGTTKKAGLLMRVFFGIAAGVMSVVTGIYVLLSAIELLDNVMSRDSTAGVVVAARQAGREASRAGVSSAIQTQSATTRRKAANNTTKNVTNTFNIKANDTMGVTNEIGTLLEMVDQ